MRDLETRLRALEVEWPATPDLATPTLTRLQRAGGAKRGRFRRPRRLAVAVALALLVPVTAALAFPSARHDVLEWLGIEGADVVRTPELPPSTPNDLGVRITLDDAERLAGFRPRTNGEPDEVRFDRDSGFVTLVYDDVLVAQARGALTEPLLQKLVGPGTGIEAVDVDGERGVYIDGVHSYLYERPSGSIGEDRPRRSRRALVFNDGDLLVRIEGPPKEEALNIARELR